MDIDDIQVIDFLAMPPSAVGSIWTSSLDHVEVLFLKNSSSGSSVGDPGFQLLLSAGFIGNTNKVYPEILRQYL